MSADNFFYLTFSELIGFIVTIISVALIVKQLSDTRLATQMSGYLALSDQFYQIIPGIEFIDSLGYSKEWDAFDGAEAYKYLSENDEYRGLYKSVAAFYEIVGALIHRGALDKKLAMDIFGELAAKRWFIIKKAALVQRKLIGTDTLYEQWELLAMKLKRNIEG